MYNFELESFQHFLPFCLFLKCWWRNCSISCIPLTAAETFLPSVTCFFLLNVLQHKVKLNFQSALMNVWKCHGSGLSGPQRGLGAFWHLLWAFYCPETEHTDVQFVSPILPNSRIIPPPSHRHHRSIRPSLSSIPPTHPPTPAIWKHQSILQATVPSHSLGGQLSFITHCAVRQQHRSIFQFHNSMREEGGGDNKLNKSSKKEEEVGVTKTYEKEEKA